MRKISMFRWPMTVTSPTFIMGLVPLYAAPSDAEESWESQIASVSPALSSDQPNSFLKFAAMA